MNRKLFTFLVFICSIVVFSSCVDDDDNNTVSEEWKTYNDKQVREASATGSGYSPRSSISGNGSVYWKSITDFIPGDAPSIDRLPIFTDSISMRYEGWFYTLDGTKYTFDSTEGDNNNIPARIRVNKLVDASGNVNIMTDGFRTMLQNMKIDEQVEVCIPYLLGYGTSGRYYNSTIIVPGYTTFWAKIKLLNIYDEDKKEWVKR